MSSFPMAPLLLLLRARVLLLLVVGLMLCATHPLERLPLHPTVEANHPTVEAKNPTKPTATVETNSTTDAAGKNEGRREVADDASKGVIQSSSICASVQEGEATPGGQDGAQIPEMGNEAVPALLHALVEGFECLDAEEYSKLIRKEESEHSPGLNATQVEGNDLVIDIALEDLVVKARKLIDGRYHLQITEPLALHHTVLMVARPGVTAASLLPSPTPSEGPGATEPASDFYEEEKPEVWEANSAASTNSWPVPTSTHQRANTPTNNVSSSTLQSPRSSRICDQQLGVYILHTQTLKPSQDLLVVREDCGQLIVDRIPYKKAGKIPPKTDKENIGRVTPDPGREESVMKIGVAEPDEPLPCLTRYIRDGSQLENVEGQDCEAYETGKKNDFTNDEDSQNEKVEQTSGTEGDVFGSNDTVDVKTDKTTMESVKNTTDANFSSITLAPEPLSDINLPCLPHYSTTCLVAKSDGNAPDGQKDVLTTNSSREDDPGSYSDDAVSNRLNPFHAIVFPGPDSNSRPHKPRKPQRPIVFPSRDKEESIKIYLSEVGSNTSVADQRATSLALPSLGDTKHSVTERSPRNQTGMYRYYSSSTDSNRANEIRTSSNVLGRILHEIVFPQR